MFPLLSFRGRKRRLHPLWDVWLDRRTVEWKRTYVWDRKTCVHPTQVVSEGLRSESRSIVPVYVLGSVRSQERGTKKSVKTPSLIKDRRNYDRHSCTTCNGRQYNTFQYYVQRSSIREKVFFDPRTPVRSLSLSLLSLWGPSEVGSLQGPRRDPHRKGTLDVWHGHWEGHRNRRTSTSGQWQLFFRLSNLYMSVGCFSLHFG